MFPKESARPELEIGLDGRGQVEIFELRILHCLFIETVLSFGPSSGARAPRHGERHDSAYLKVGMMARSVSHQDSRSSSSYQYVINVKVDLSSSQVVR